MPTAKVIATTDFLGEYFIPEKAFFDYQTYLDTYEEEYLSRILGATLYAAFIADIPAVGDPPTAPEFVALYEPFKIDHQDTLITYSGLVPTLVQLVYFHIMRDLPIRKSETGVTINNSENSVNLGFGGYNLITAYNKGVMNTKSLQWYIDQNISSYTDYNGQALCFTSGI